MSEPSPLEEAAENVLIAWEMGWDMEGVIEELRRQYLLFQNATETEDE